MFDLISLQPGNIAQCSLVIVVIILTIAYWRSRRKSLPPGPWGIIPFLGYAPNIAYAMYRGETVPEHFSYLGRRYGKYVSFSAFGFQVVVLNDWKLIREAFQHVTLNDRGGDETVAKILSRSFNKFSDMDPFRKFTLATFRRFGIGTSGFEEPITKESTILVEELEKVIGKPVELTPYFNNATSNIISHVVFGTRFEFSDKRIHRLTGLLNKLNELSGAGGLDVFLPDIINETKRQLNKVGDELLHFIDEMIEEHRKNFDPENCNDIIDLYLNKVRLNESEDPNSFLNSKNMHGLILLLFLGGTDTTATTLRWGVQYLVKYPEVQARIQQELDSLTGRNRLPKLSDQPSLPYTQAFISELNRIVSIFPLGNLHEAAESTLFHGYTIPKNAFIIANLYGVLHDPDVWKDPEVLRPERFLDENGQMYTRDELIPFSFGRRMCLGEALAKQELFIFFTHLLHHFSFERSYEGASLPTLKPITGAVSHPEPYEVRVVKRD